MAVILIVLSPHIPRIMPVEAHHSLNSTLFVSLTVNATIAPSARMFSIKSNDLKFPSKYFDTRVHFANKLSLLIIVDISPSIDNLTISPCQVDPREREYVGSRPTRVNMAGNLHFFRKYNYIWRYTPRRVCPLSAC